jgi:hypothetical protein
MVDHPFIVDLERDEFSDQNYSVLGRAISICVQFEQDVNVLRMFVEIQKEIGRLSLNETSYDEIAKRIWKMSLHNKIASSLTAGELVESLTKAKNARNFIVHELSIGIQNDIRTDKGREYLIQTLEVKLGDLLNGWYLVLLFHSIINKQDGLPRMEDFTKSNVEWVLSIE